MRGHAGLKIQRQLKRARVFAITKGFRGRIRNVYSVAARAAERAKQYSYIGRKLKKRDFRKLWIQRINFGVREHGLSYSQFMRGLAESDVQLDRKVLSELAIHEPRSFKALSNFVKTRMDEAGQGLKLLTIN